jgi:DnaJ-domain-containing protein 1
VKWIVAIAAIWAVWVFMRKSTRAPIGRSAERDARALLGVSAGADEDAIRAAHRRLLADVHPDRGGSADLAGRANAARDLLLRRAG